MLTKEELNAIGERCEKATPNPELTRYDHGGGRSFLQTGDWESLHGKRDRKLVADYYNEEDREFYHACRTDIPTLLAHIEEKELRILLANELARKESVEVRMDVAWAHWEEGLPIYIGSSAFPGLLEEVHEDGTRILGCMVNRKFVPVENLPDD